MKPPARPRGIALPLAVFALVMVGALVSGAFFVGRQEQALGRNSVRLQQAFAAAEAGAQQTVAEWDPVRFNALEPGNSGAIPSGRGSTGWFRGEVRRLNPQLFLIDSEGFSPDSTARQHVGLLVRLRPLRIPITAALASRGAVGSIGGWLVDGTDTPPSGWDCPPAGPPVPGTRTPPDSVALADLAAAASTRVEGGSLTIEPVLSGSVCQVDVATNWGSPLTPQGPCGRYFPVIWSESSLTVTGGEGQGVLIVNGDLSVQGGFRFFGPVVVTGNLRVGGAGAEFLGGVIAGRAESTTGPVAIRYSSCALDLALGGSATVELLRERSWVNLY